MAKNWVHPAVRRGTIFWGAQIVGTGVLVVAFIVIALSSPSTQSLVTAVAAVAIGGPLTFMGVKQIKAVRYEYRYDDDGSEGPAG